MNGQPGAVVLVRPEDILLDEVDAADRLRVERPDQLSPEDAIAAVLAAVDAAVAPLAIVGERAGAEMLAR